MSDKRSLFNTFTVVAAIIFGVQGIFSHNFYLKAFNCLALLFLLVALYYELLDIYGKKSKLISPGLFILIAALYFLDPISSIERSESEKQIKVLQDSLLIYRDSIKRYQFMFALAETERNDSQQRLELAKEYFDAKNEPSIRLVDMTPTVEIGKKLSIDWRFENTGPTLSQVQVYFTLIIHTVPYAEFILYDNTKSIIKDFSRNEIKTLTSSRKDELTKDFYDEMLAGHLYVYSYGRFEYTDKFKKKYKKDFCDVYDKDVKSFRDMSNYRFVYEKTKANK